MIGSLSGWPPLPNRQHIQHLILQMKKTRPREGLAAQGHTARQRLQSQTSLSSITGSQAGQLWLPRRHLAMSKDILECHN